MRKQREKFPKLLLDLITMSDIILDVLDARFIDETRDIEVEKQIKKWGKTIIYVLNKSDLTNTKKLDREKLKEIYPYALISCKEHKGIGELRDRIKIEADKIKKDTRVNVGVIGYPNTGKSSVINLLIGKSSAKTASQAGFTKGIQKLKLSSDILLLDSPGVIPQREYSTTIQKSISQQAKIGAKTIDKLKNPELAVDNLMKEFPFLLEKHYDIDAEGDSEILIETLGRKLNILKKKNEINSDQVARKILKDWQEGKIRIE